MRRPWLAEARSTATRRARARVRALVPIVALVIVVSAGCTDGTAPSEQAPPASPAVQPTAAPAMGPLLAEIARRAPDTNPYTGDREARAFRSLIADPAFGRTPRRRWNLLRELGFHELRLGNVEAAIGHYEGAWALARDLGDVLLPADVDQTQFDLAVSHLRLGETQNCVAMHTSDSCILPIRDAGVHRNQTGSRNGIRELEALLARNPQHLAARWLVNVAYMTIGEYPDGVPADYVIDPHTFASAESFPRFTDVAPARRVNTTDLSGGVVIDDFDGDGRLDLVTSSFDPARSLTYFHGTAAGVFSERTEEAGLAELLGGLTIAQADYDDDGDLDLFVTRGGWLDRVGRHPNSLLRNDGQGRFTDVTFEAGLGDVHYPTQTAAWADYDDDGDLDLYVGNEWWANSAFPSQLFRNDGAGRFVDVAAHAGVTNERLAKGIVWGDFDDDGDADLYVSNHNGHNRLYRNRGDGTFEDVAAAAGVQAPWSSHGVVTWDYDNDGVLDLYVAVASPEHAPEVDEDRVDELAPLQATVASQLGLSDAEEYGRLYRGLGDMRFRDVTKEMGLDRVVLTGGLGVGDLDGDGYLDLYLGTSYPGYEGLLPNVMYHNRGGTGFSDVTTAGGFGHLQKTLGLAFADLDADGDQDVFVRAGGMFAGDAFGDVLFDNPGFGAHWLAVRLAGRKSNHSAIGARIRCVVEHDGRQRTIHRRVGEGGSAGAGPLEQWIGLGDAVEVSTLEITWPSGTRQTLRNVPVDQRLDITEAVSD